MRKGLLRALRALRRARGPRRLLAVVRRLEEPLARTIRAYSRRWLSRSAKRRRNARAPLRLRRAQRRARGARGHTRRARWARNLTQRSRHLHRHRRVQGASPRPHRPRLRADQPPAQSGPHLKTHWLAPRQPTAPPSRWATVRARRTPKGRARACVRRRARRRRPRKPHPPKPHLLAPLTPRPARQPQLPTPRKTHSPHLATSLPHLVRGSALRAMRAAIAALVRTAAVVPRAPRAPTAHPTTPPTPPALIAPRVLIAQNANASRSRPQASRCASCSACSSWRSWR